MSVQSELNPASEPLVEKPQETTPNFEEFESKVDNILKKYGIESFDIRCFLNSSCMYLNTNDSEDAIFQNENKEPATALTAGQMTIPCVKELFSIFQEFHISSFCVDMWTLISDGRESHIYVAGKEGFDYSWCTDE